MVVADFGFGFGGTEIHLLAGHTDPIDGEQGIAAAGQPGPGFDQMGQWFDQAVGKGNGGRSPAGQGGDLGQNFPERQIIAAKNIPLADSAAVEGQQMAGRDIIHMNDVEPGST